MIARFEGLRLTAYKCPAGVWTIGYGHTEGVKEGDEITREQAERMLFDDTEQYRLAVDKAVSITLNYNEMEALTSLCYNIGIRGFTNSTLVNKLNQGDKLGAAMEFPKWSKIGRERSRGLLRRRMAEAELFLTA